MTVPKAQGTPVKTTLKAWEIKHSNKLNHEAAVAAATSPAEAEGEFRPVSFHALLESSSAPFLVSFSAGRPAGCVLDPFYTDRSEGILNCPAVLVQFAEWETVPSVRPQRNKPRCVHGTLHDALENHQSFHLGLCESLSWPTTGLEVAEQADLSNFMGELK